MTTVWYVDHDNDAPEPVECETPGYPNRDVQGRTMYGNSHYATEELAWEVMRASGSTSQDMARREYESAQRGLKIATEILAREAARRTRIDAGCEEFKRRQEKA